jgi:diguanylate cyclase (GGDEF)-like protein/PAS domain S-box-containing protein
MATSLKRECTPQIQLMKNAKNSAQQGVAMPHKKVASPLIRLVTPSLSVVMEALEHAEKNRAGIALNSISDAVLCTDLHGNVDYLNIAAEALTGWTKSEAYGQPIAKVFNIIHASSRFPASDLVTCVLKTKAPIALATEILLIQRDGAEVLIEDSSSPIYNATGQLTGVVVVFHELSEAKANATKMAHLAHHDFLTNLPNRVLLNDRITHAIEVAKRNDTQISMLFLDLDHFKHINDSLGHHVGDQLLRQVTASLNACVRASDTVSRQGGDEFIILLADGKHSEDAAHTAEKICALFALPHKLANHQLHVSTSIGISVYPTDGLDAETLIKNADTAMYSAKENGRNNYQFFKPEMNTRAVERQNIEADLHIAIAQEQLFLKYQPKFNLNTQALTGLEVLIRWQHPEWGEIMPERFMPTAEDSGLIIPIGRWVLREACHQAKRWADSGNPDIQIAVNISAPELMHKTFVSDLQTILLETGVAAKNIALEMTETVLMRDAKASALILQKLKAMGIVLVVDNFGTGYSSLRYLEAFPIDTLKIDRSFVGDINTITNDGVMVTAIINMSNSLKLNVIAEGIETPEQFAFLQNHHCLEGQGHLFSYPLSGEQFTQLYLTPAKYVHAARAG